MKIYYEEHKKIETNIKKIIIRKLHGEKDIILDIYNNCLIVVGDNGFGKTSLLNIVCSLISGEIKYLKDINFESVNIVFFKNEKIHRINIERKELDAFKYVDSHLDERIYISRFRNERYIQREIFDEYQGNIDDILKERYIRMSEKELKLSYKRVLNKFKRIKEGLGFETLFLPTYRRIEQRLEYFGISELKDDNINFGMNDVKKAIKNITDEIIHSSIDWISRVNAQMINEILEYEDVLPSINIYNKKIIIKTLDRIDDNYLSNHSKNRILRMIDNGKIYENKTLLYFLNNMLKLYEQQNENDNKLIRFSEICNKYLKNKKIKYDEVKVELHVVKITNNIEEYIDFNVLSSGEKQIISIFARLILTQDKNIAVIFDEPEISISIDWQRMLLEDIYNLDNCGFLIASTHSPFVFSNKLKSYTVDIEENIGY